MTTKEWAKEIAVEIKQMFDDGASVDAVAEK